MTHTKITHDKVQIVVTFTHNWNVARFSVRHYGKRQPTEEEIYEAKLECWELLKPEKNN